MLREQGMAEGGATAKPTGKFWSMIGGVSGGAMGFIFANFPGAVAVSLFILFSFSFFFFFIFVILKIITGRRGRKPCRCHPRCSRQERLLRLPGTASGRQGEAAERVGREGI